jgi:beta-xylosidase
MILMVIMTNKNKQKLEIRTELYYTVSYKLIRGLPGLPILHSKDMVNWTIVNHVIAKVDLPGYEIPQHGKGIWAPSIRFHDNKFWVFVSTPDEGIFMSTAEDPFGSWSPLHMIKEVKGWIDPVGVMPISTRL